MQLEAKLRLLSLTQKQKQLDINGDGKIDGKDLKKVRQGKKPVKAASGTFSPDFLKTLGNEMKAVAYSNMSSEEEREDYVSNSAEEQLDYALGCLHDQNARHRQAGKKYPDEMKSFLEVPIDKQIKLLLPYFKRAT